MKSKLISYIKRKLAYRSNGNYIAFLRKSGVTIGMNTVFRDPKSTRIDITRPSLVEIGNNVDINVNFTILTHDYASSVFLNLYHDFIPSSGPVTIGNNIYFGCNVTILKGVEIGDNCVIGACSLVNSSIPPNSVAVGVPAKVICSIDDYYKRRLAKYENEAIYYAKSISRKFSRDPIIDDFWEEFPLFIESNNMHLFNNGIIRKQLGCHYEKWLINHKAKYKSFNDFLGHCKIKDGNNE